jgi:hypothetical protein
MTRILSYDDLKKENRKALSALITLWEELSRCSRESARKDLKEDWGFRYSVTGELGDGQYTLIFKDDHSGDRFHYHDYRKKWI